jgi:hypothetical protein
MRERTGRGGVRTRSGPGEDCSQLFKQTKTAELLRGRCIMMRFSIPHCSTTFGLLKRIATEWSTDNATRWSASVAFYTLLSLAPLLVPTVAIADLVYGKKVAPRQLVLGLRDLVGF